MKQELGAGTDVEVALAPIGSELARRCVQAFQRVSLRKIAAPGECRRNKLGHRYPGPRSARTAFADAPLVGPNAPQVRGGARALVAICSWLAPGRRTTGHPAQEHRLALGRLAHAAGCKARQLEHYLVVLEQAGLVKRWQPPRSSGAPKGPRGYCFNLYQLAIDMPHELAAELARWHGTAVANERAELAALAVARAAPPPTFASSDPAAEALAFVKRGGRGPPPDVPY